ncbi:hypothetical protein XHC_0993 [Xanthomonas hortorum pv. carotae str. M081]|nr:hypothetical protein XHC_0993 [Xanthomonas hortorum pv. carotae str. M081]
MHLVVDQVVQLQVVHVADRGLAIECFAGTTVVQLGLTALRQFGQFQHALDFRFAGAVEHRGGHRHTVDQVLAQVEQFLIAELRQIHALCIDRAVVVVDVVQELAQLADRRLGFQHALDLATQALGGPAQMHFQNLADVHTRRHAERVQHDVDRLAGGHVRHVLDRHDVGDHTLVAVAACHLVTRLDAALHCQEHLDHLQHARCEVVALGDLAALVGEACFEFLLVRLDLLLRALDGIGCVFVLHAQLEPIGLLQPVQIRVGDVVALLQVRTAIGDLAHDLRAQTCVDGRFQDTELVVEVLLDALDFGLFDLTRTLVLLDAVAGEDLHVDDGAVHARGHAQRAVLHVGRLLTEDRTQQLFFRSQLAFALRRDLADHDVAGAHFRTDVHHAAFVQTVQGLLGHVRDVGGNFLRPQLGVARNAGQFFDVDRGVTILFHHALGEQDGVFEVVAVPRHEGDQHVLTQGQLTDVGGRAVGQHVAARDHVTHVHQRTLVDAGVLVGAGVLDQVVDIHAGIGAAANFCLVDLDHDTGCVDLLDHATTQRIHGYARVARNRTLDTGTDQGLLRTQRRHGLALHVGAHQCTVGVIVFQERNQRRGDRHGLHRRDVHEVHFGRRLQQRLALEPARHELFGEHVLGIGQRVRLGDHVLVFFDRRQVLDVVGDLTVQHLAVRGFKEAVLVGTGKHGQRVDQADVRAFRCFDGADAAVMGRMHVAHFEAGALAGQTARAQCGDATLVRHFRQRVVLIHELRQLRGAEEFLDRSSHRLGVDQFLRGQTFGFGHRQALLDRALDADQAHAEHVLGHFADRTHATVAQVIDVIDHAATVADLGEHFEHFQDVGGVGVLGDQALGLFVVTLGKVLLVVQHRLAKNFLAADATVELHPADRGQVVALEGEEQVVEQVLCGFLGRRLARTHHAVDLDQRFQLGLGRIDTQGVGQVRTTIQIVHPQGADRIDAGLAERSQLVFGDLVVGIGQQFAGRAIDHVVRQDARDQIIVRHGQRGDAGGFELLDVTRGDALARFHDDLVAIGQVEVQRFATQTLRHQLQLHAFVRIDVEGVDLEELGQHLFVVVAKRTQQDRHRQLATTVDTGEQRILRVELEVQPGAAVRNDAGAVEQLARTVGLATVVVEEHTRRAVQLREDHALGAVDDEGTVVGHQRDFAQIDLLLLHVLDGLGRRLAVVDHQAHGHAQRRAVAHATLTAFTLVKHRLTQLVTDVFQRGVAAVAGNREHRLQRCVQTEVLALVLLHVFLQEFAVGVHLDRKQERHFENRALLTEILADTLFFGERIRRHEVFHPRLRGQRRRGPEITKLSVGSRWYCRHQHAFSCYFQLPTR